MKQCYFLMMITWFSQAQISGCTDPQSLNYNPQAEINNGNCLYAPSVATITSSANMPDVLNETSGIIASEGSFLTHNDDTDTNLYQLDVAGNIINQFSTGLSNVDWEDLAQDGQYYYIGDFGNNASGNRQDLRIYRMLKQSIGQESAIDTISFSYQDQLSLQASAPNSTEFDCEAFIVTSEKIYLFTKKWSSQTTSVYEVSKDPGNHIAQLRSAFNINGLVTGAAFVEDKRMVVLSGYSGSLQPFAWLLYDYANDDFFSGNKRKIGINLPLHQVEGICSVDGQNFYITNERFQFGSITVPAKIHTLDLSEFTQNITGSLSQNENSTSKISLVYNKEKRILEVNKTLFGKMSIYDTTGKLTYTGALSATDVSSFPKGIYLISINAGDLSTRTSVAIY